MYYKETYYIVLPGYSVHCPLTDTIVHKFKNFYINAMSRLQVQCLKKKANFPTENHCYKICHSHGSIILLQYILPHESGRDRDTLHKGPGV